MPSFPKPSSSSNYQVATEVQNLRDYREDTPGRAVPAKKGTRLLIATWNIAKLGAQARRTRDYRLMAEIISWFDIVAIQECKDDRSGLCAIQDELPGWAVLVSDKGGNDERMVFLYDAAKVQLLEKVGEVAVPPKDTKFIKLPGIARKFTGFDRNPYLAAFVSRAFDFDGGIFPALWNNKTEAQFRSYLRYYISEHSQLWAQLRAA